MSSSVHTGAQQELVTAEEPEYSKRVATNTMRVRDPEIRKALYHRLLTRFPPDGNTLLLHEFACETARIDMAVVNGSLHGYEIKSDADKLSRLPNQVSTYGKAFDYVTLVVGSRHLEESIEIIPNWWGVMKVNTKCSSVRLSIVRRPKRNLDRDALTVAKMMWKDEALKLLKRMCNLTGLSRMSATQIWVIVSQRVEIEVIAEAVRNAIRARGGSGFEKLSAQHDDLRTTLSSTAPESLIAKLDWLLLQQSPDLRR